MRARPFRQVDVFGSGPYTGNPVAVILDGEGLSDEDMARLSAWTNLSECTFVVAPTVPGADYRVRIFSLSEELPFAGHPTLGTARAWIDAGGQPRDPAMVVQECGIGLVPVRVDGDRLAFAAPELLRSGDVAQADLAAACERLGIAHTEVVDAAWVDNGPGWLGIMLADATRVLELSPEASARPEATFVGVVGMHADGGQGEPVIEVRAFFSEPGGPLREDPITGSLNASLAQWLVGKGRLEVPYIAAQGTAVGRRGRVSVTADAGETWVGGRTHVAVTGMLEA